MEIYNIIKDEQTLKDFIDWLPELQPDEKYYICLFARNKYCKELTHIKTDKAQLKRIVTNKERMINKIRQLEVVYGQYTQKQMVVPQQALALYITVNPRNMLKATVNTMVKLAQSIRDQNTEMNPHQSALSEIQKAKSRNCYVDFDVDFKKADRELEYHTFKRIIQHDCGLDTNFEILETRGGYHVLIDPSTIDQSKKNSWYNNLNQALRPDQIGDLMIPVPGCTQGGFIPKFLKF